MAPQRGPKAMTTMAMGAMKYPVRDSLQTTASREKGMSKAPLPASIMIRPFIHKECLGLDLFRALYFFG